MNYRVFLLFLLFFSGYTLFSQNNKVYEINLGLERSQKNVDDYGNNLPFGEEASRDFMYIQEKELKYIIDRSKNVETAILGGFNIDGIIKVNNKVVNTRWSFLSNRYYIGVTDIETGEKTHYIIPEIEISNKIQKRRW
jgi:hypothetical protein